MLSTTRRVAVHVRRKAAKSRRLIFEFDRVAKLVHYTNVQYIRVIMIICGIWRDQTGRKKMKDVKPRGFQVQRDRVEIHRDVDFTQQTISYSHCCYLRHILIVTRPC